MIGKFIQYLGDFQQEKETSSQISEGTRLSELSLKNSMKIPNDHVIDNSARGNF